MTKKYFICEHLHRLHLTHGGITNVDAEKIFLDNGYQPILFPHTFSFSAKAKLARFLYLLKIFFRVPAGASVIFQFPLYARIHMLLIKLLRWKKARIICCIADIEGLRNLDGPLLQNEKEAFRHFNRFIVHNERMAQWLKVVVGDARMVQIEFFDFLARPASTHRVKSHQVVFAGNLEKSPFIKDMASLNKHHPQVHFHIYGPGYQPSAQSASNVQYKGAFEVHEIIDRLQGSFGLIWDGDSVENCSGKYGEYLAYNSPHKLSLYILSGLPIIAPNMSASAYLVKKYGIGITIDSLSDIGSAIDAVGEIDYRQMVENMKPMATSISTGQCIGNALAAIEATNP